MTSHDRMTNAHLCFALRSAHTQPTNNAQQMADVWLW